MASKLPYIQFYPGDWLRDGIAGCSLEAQGLWLRMMFVMHDSDRYGYLSQDGMAIRPDALARRCGCSLDQYMALLTELTSAGVPQTTPEGVIYSRRMVRDGKTREARVISGIKGGKRSGKTRRKYIEANMKQNPEDEDVVVVSSVVVTDKTEPTTKTTSGYLAKTDPVSRVIYAYKRFKGFEQADRGWDQRNWARCMKTAPKILDLAKGDPIIAERYVKAFGEWADKKRMEYRIETLVKCYDDWMSENGR